MTHGQEAQARRHDEYQRQEIASLRDQLRQAEDKLGEVSRRVELLERMLTNQDGSVHAGPNGATGG